MTLGQNLKYGGRIGNTALKGTNIVPTSSSAGNNLNVFLGKNCRIIGKLELSGESQVDGIVEGEICSTGTLVLGSTSKVEARVNAENTTVCGEFKGDITCTKRLELASNATVSGKIVSPVLVIQDGASFEGQCSMTNTSLEAEPASTKFESSSTISLDNLVEE